MRFKTEKGDILMDKKIKEIREISCDAEKCVYHSPDSKCMAGSIEVGCPDAQSCGETNCATFELNTDCC